MQPLVSVIIPTHNRAQFIAETVESVLDQTYQNMETIVIDDGSTDNTREVLRKYEEKIEYIYQERAERSKARNEGVRHSRGAYIALLDSDDVWLPTKVQEQVHILNEKPDVGVVYTGVEFIDEYGNPYSGEICWDEPVRRVLYEDLMTHNVVTGSLSAIMVRRECLDKVGLFDESMTICEDLDLYRRIARYYKFHKIDLPLVKIRIHDDNTQREFITMAKGWEATISKISRDTPREYEYYKYEAILKILRNVAGLYREAGRTRSFFSFCARSLLDRPNWILKCNFWRDVVRLIIEKYMNKPVKHEECSRDFRSENSSLIRDKNAK